MKTILALFFLASAYLASGQSIMSTCMKSTWDPRNLMGQKGGVVMWIDAGNTNCRTNNGATISGLGNLADSTKLNLGQSTAANQPILSRADNSGNLFKQSDALDSAAWSRLASGTGSAPSVTTSQTDPLGGSTAFRIQFNKGAGTTTSDYSLLSQSFVIDGSAIQTIWLKSNDGLTHVLNWRLGANQANQISVTTTWTEFPFTATVTPTDSTHWLGLRGSQSPVNDATADLLAWRPSLRVSTWNSTYVSTTSTPAFPGLSGRSVLYFDGTSHYMKTLATTLNQPEEIYMGLMQWTWTDAKQFYDGTTATSGSLLQRASSPTIRINAGAGSTADNTGLSIGVWGVSKAIFFGTASSITVNNTAPTIGNAGTSSMSGLVIGGSYSGGALANFLFSKAIICNKTNAPAEANYIGWGIKKQCKVQ